MSDDTHLDDEQLSGILDGDEAPAHLATCMTCSVRLSELRRASELVAVAPPALSDGRRRILLERAVTVAHPAANRTPAGSGEGDNARVVPLRARAASRWLGIAAALAVVAGIGVVLTTRDARDETSIAADRDTTAAAELATDEVPLVDGGDLGPRTDAAELGQLVRSGIAVPTTMAAAAPAADENAKFEAPSALSDAAGTGGARASSPLVCTREARRDFGSGIGRFVYGAVLEWQGTPAVLLAYEAKRQGEGPVSYFGVILAREGCQPLTSFVQQS